MTKFLLGLLILSTLSFSTTAQSGRVPFKSFEVIDYETKDSPTFFFSEAYATSASPVVITVPGRKLTNADRTFRTSLQKHWLSVNVPDVLEIQSRSLSKCDLKRKGEYSMCDLYVFLDPTTKKQHEYYIYVGNWP